MTRWSSRGISVSRRHAAWSPWSFLDRYDRDRYSWKRKHTRGRVRRLHNASEAKRAHYTRSRSRLSIDWSSTVQNPEVENQTTVIFESTRPEEFFFLPMSYEISLPISHFAKEELLEFSSSLVGNSLRLENTRRRTEIEAAWSMSDMGTRHQRASKWFMGHDTGRRAAGEGTEKLTS